MNSYDQNQSHEATIFRSPHDLDNPYVQINRKPIRFDNEISLEATGLLAYLLSLPNNWYVRVKEVALHKTNSEKSFYKTFNELIEKGYIKRHDILKENPKGGKIRTGCNYEVSEMPIFKPERISILEENSNNFYRNSQNRDGGNRDRDNRHIKNKEYKEKREYDKKESSNAGVRAIPSTQPLDPEKEQKKNFIRNSKWPQNYIPDEEHTERWSKSSMANLRKALRVAKEKMPRDCEKPEAYITTVLRNAKSTDHIEDNIEKVMELKNQGYLKSFEIRFDQLVHVTGKKISLEAHWTEIEKTIKHTAISSEANKNPVGKTEQVKAPQATNAPDPRVIANKRYFNGIWNKLTEEEKKAIKIEENQITLRVKGKLSDEIISLYSPEWAFKQELDKVKGNLNAPESEIDFKIA